MFFFLFVIFNQTKMVNMLSKIWSLNNPVSLLLPLGGVGAYHYSERERERSLFTTNSQAGEKKKKKKKNSWLLLCLGGWLIERIPEKLITNFHNLKMATKKSLLSCLFYRISLIIKIEDCWYHIGFSIAK